eukprot:TRINITY_DN9098_c0_g1_i1.p1 TRINITY_DN9098_c0_g1~~TRINITY_DN9098_c0_g1_i1.p1  ORF type:complete len:268 (-),score=53.35 TRINITY_DN9098_c0_g1_i1:148-951(-)
MPDSPRHLVSGALDSFRSSLTCGAVRPRMESLEEEVSPPEGQGESFGAIGFEGPSEQAFAGGGYASEFNTFDMDNDLGPVAPSTPSAHAPSEAGGSDFGLPDDLAIHAGSFNVEGAESRVPGLPGFTPPQVLRVALAAPAGAAGTDADLLGAGGDYDLCEELSLTNGMPVWRKRHAEGRRERWLFSSVGPDLPSEGRWCIHGQSAKERNFAGKNYSANWLWLDAPHDGRLPHEVDGPWRRWGTGEPVAALLAVTSIDAAGTSSRTSL